LRLATAALGLVAVGLLGAQVGPGARPRSATRAGSKVTRTVVVIENLEQGRQFAAVVDREKPSYARLDGVLRNGDEQARVAAFLQNGSLRLIDEIAAYGDHGGTARNRYYVHDGRLAFYQSVRVHPRDVGKNRRPARDEVVTALAYDSGGKLVGSERTVNREPAPLEPADLNATHARFAALAGAVGKAK
jgi:hypothetical protein